MKLLCPVVAALVVRLSGVGAVPAPAHLDGRDTIFAELAPHLSADAAIILSTDLAFAKHQRWQAYSQPRYSAVVEVATEEDVGVVV